MIELGLDDQKILPAHNSVNFRRSDSPKSRGCPSKNSVEQGVLDLSGTGDSQRDSRESIRANHSQLKPLFL